MLLVGLTGGIGAGKSTVARILAARGAVVIDADAISREVVRPGTPALRRIIEHFGPEARTPDGELDRARIAEIVFKDDDARASLNAIVHPEVMKVIAERIDSLTKTDAIVVLDVPLLVEVGGGEGVDLLVVVEAAEDMRVERLVRDRSMRPEEVRSRIGAQATEEERKALADVVIRNERDERSLEAQVDELWSRIEGLRAGDRR